MKKTTMIVTETPKILTRPGALLNNEEAMPPRSGIHDSTCLTTPGVDSVDPATPKSTCVTFCIRNAEIPVATAAPPIRQKAKIYLGT